MGRAVRLATIFIYVGAFAQSCDFDSLASAFETRMNAAASSLMKKQPARALDGFIEARDWISRQPISYGDSFAWSGCRALMSYAVVLARLAEAEVDSSIQTPLTRQIRSQAREWADILSKQSESWSKIEPCTPGQTTVRLKWIKRFQSVIVKTHSKPFLE
jgi:hypothetical protein